MVDYTKIWKTKKATLAHTRKILASLETDAILKSEEYLSFLLQLFSRHPHAKEKFGSGIKNITARRGHPRYPGRCFWIQRLDNSWIDISFHECLRASTPLQNFCRAMRYVVQEQIDNFRRKAFLNRTYIICPENKTKVYKHNCHVDHYKPQFIEIVRRFIKEYDVNVKVQEYDKVLNTIKDDKIKNQFYDFHKKVCVLRITSISGNLRRSKC